MRKSELATRGSPGARPTPKPLLLLSLASFGSVYNHTKKIWNARHGAIVIIGNLNRIRKPSI